MSIDTQTQNDLTYPSSLFTSVMRATCRVAPLLPFFLTQQPKEITITLQEQLLTEHKVKIAKEAKQQEDLAISRANNCYMIRNILRDLGFIDAEATLNGKSRHEVTATFLDHKFSINVCYDGTVRIQPPKSPHGTHGWADIKQDLSDLIPTLKYELAYALNTGLTPNKETKCN